MRELVKYGASALLLAAGVVAAAPSYAEGTIKIGWLSPTSGGAASVGVPQLEGAEVAVQEINDAGGVLGMKIELLARDTQATPNVAVAAAKELISKEGVKVILGPSTSGAALAISEVAKAEKIVQILPSAKSKQLTDEKLHKYIFQMSATTDTDAERLFAIAQKVGAKKVCFAGYDYAYTTDLFDAARKLVEADPAMEAGGQYMIKLGATDFSTIVSQLMADSCDTIFGGVWGGGFTAFAKQAEPFGLFKSKKLVWGGTMGAYEAAVALKGAFPEGLYSHSPDLWYADGNAEHQAYLQSFEKYKGTKEPASFAILGYIGVKTAVAAIEKAGEVDADKIVAALEGMTISTPVGETTIDPKSHRADLPEFYGPIV
ncbi:MAG: ABC transporter substrate-binding protein, partial [Flavobacteriaceae bacterium]